MHTADGGKQQSCSSTHIAEQGMPLNPCVPILCEPPRSHTHRHLSPNHAPAPDADQTPSSAPQRTLRLQTNTLALLCPTEDTQTPDQPPSIALPHRGHSDSRPAPQHCSAPFLAFPCPTISFPTSLHGPSTPQSLSPVPLSLAPGTARITP